MLLRPRHRQETNLENTAVPRLLGLHFVISASKYGVGPQLICNSNMIT